ncbi:Are2p [Sugiyamaella lignohabitans]|uniref:Are2p n=1 Tax=Sugiyamaella lignohabitans TaxID=796027 RepID=A0A167DJW8_9ASCO|nr:Are2p [Sugiyamaella lignohabitans]ANB12998.1 Are2p [Sugiyamaella lignohabitans]
MARSTGVASSGRKLNGSKTDEVVSKELQTDTQSHILDPINLSEVDTDLRSYREHLNFDNAYDDSASSTPKLSPISEPGSVTSADMSPSALRGQTLHRRTTSSSSASSLSNGFVLSADRTSKVKQTEVHLEGSEKKVLKSINEKSATKKEHRRYSYRNLSSHSQASILDAEASRSSVFFGFYTLFWVTIAFLIVRGSIYNYIRTSQLLGTNIVDILRKDLIKIALTDVGLYLGIYFAFFWQVGIKYGILDWNQSGWIVQHIWQACYLGFVLWFNEYMQFPWIGCVFLLLHSLVLVMKQHSYAFYNGHFWSIKSELDTASAKLLRIESSNSIITPEAREVIGRLKSQMEFCSEELRLQSEKTPFPANINLKNFFDYSMFPTLVYQIEYPRTSKIRWGYVLEKTLATFGVFFLMIIVAENYLYPIAMRALALRDNTLYEKVLHYPLILMDLVPPFILIYLLVFYIIWDAILNAIAELTRFGDRQFYGEWWNCVTWDQFAKDWNTPVHRFLLRHVYHSSISSFHISKQQATCKYKLVRTWRIFYEV